MHRYLVLTVLALLSGCATRASADLILTGGHIVTLEAAQPEVEALAVRGNLIVALGSAAEIQKLRGPDTIVVDLKGQTAVPGLTDAHMHFSRLGKRSRLVFLDEAVSADEVVRAVKDQIATAQAGEWIRGTGWHTVGWKSKAYPTGDGLSKISRNNPVYLSGMANHAAWVNDVALELAGITSDTPDPDGGKIVRDQAGKPTGILLESAKGLVSKLLPTDTRESQKADIAKGVETALAFGLTQVHDAGVGPDEIGIYRELLADGTLKLRLYVMLYVPDAGETFTEYLKQPPIRDPFLTVRTFKAYADGALGARGAALLEPYTDQPGETGMVQNSPAVLEQLISGATGAGYQVAIHAIGDRGNRMVLDAAAAARKEFPNKELRVRIEHAQVISSEDIPRLAALDVIASMQPIHATMDMGFAPDRLGPDRINGAYAWRSLLSSGAHVAGSADTPAFPVKYSNPLWGMHAAITRQNASGKPNGGWTPNQRVSRLDALRMYTVHAAYAAFEEDIRGTLAVGKLADITVLSRDILTVPAAEILETQATLTIVDGKVVWRRKAP